MGVKILTINPVSYFIAVCFRRVFYDEHLDIFIHKLMTLGVIVWKVSAYFHNTAAVIKFAKRIWCVLI